MTLTPPRLVETVSATCVVGPSRVPVMTTISPGDTAPVTRLAAFPTDVTVIGGSTGGGGATGVCGGNNPVILATQASPLGSFELRAPPYLGCAALAVTGKLVDPVSPLRYAAPASSSATL